MNRIANFAHPFLCTGSSPEALGHRLENSGDEAGEKKYREEHWNGRRSPILPDAFGNRAQMQQHQEGH